MNQIPLWLCMLACLYVPLLDTSNKQLCLSPEAGNSTWVSPKEAFTESVQAVWAQDAGIRA